MKTIYDTTDQSALTVHYWIEPKLHNANTANADVKCVHINTNDTSAQSPAPNSLISKQIEKFIHLIRFSKIVINLNEIGLKV